MPLFRLSQRLSRSEPFIPADLLDAPAERVVAQGRLVLCALSVWAIHLDPTEPARYATTAYGLLIAYFAFSAALVALTILRILGPATRLVIHFVDIAVVSILLFLTDGPTSPFFAFFTFILLAATMRWRARAVLITAVALALVLLTASFLEAANPIPPEPADYALNKAVIRGAYLIVIGAMLAYVTAYRDRCR